MEEKNDLTDVLLETHHLLRRYHMTWYGKNFGGLDPQQGQGRILSTLWKRRSISQRELGRLLDIRPQSLGELLQRLEANGYITRHRSEKDKRSLIVELTERGEFFQLLKPDYEELLIDLNAREKATLKKCLEKISERLIKLIKREHDDEFY